MATVVSADLSLSYGVAIAARNTLTSSFDVFKYIKTDAISLFDVHGTIEQEIQFNFDLDGRFNVQSELQSNFEIDITVFTKQIQVELPSWFVISSVNQGTDISTTLISSFNVGSKNIANPVLENKVNRVFVIPSREFVHKI